MAASTQNQNTYEHTSRYAKYGVEPLWEVMHSMVPKMPGPQAQVAIWRYKALRPVLEDAGRTVTAEEAERRVLMLKNPALGKPSSIHLALSLSLPERAPRDSWRKGHPYMRYKGSILIMSGRQLPLGRLTPYTPACS